MRLWRGDLRQSRRRTAAPQIQQALTETKTLYDADNVTYAMAAVKRAEGLIASGGGDLGLRQVVSRWSEDLAMIERLEQIGSDVPAKSPDDSMPLQAALAETDEEQALEKDRMYEACFRTCRRGVAAHPRLAHQTGIGRGTRRLVFSRQIPRFSRSESQGKKEGIIANCPTGRPRCVA